MLINNLDDVAEVLNQLERKIIKNNKRIEAVEILFNNINEINYINKKESEK
tara:strand:+ start:110 stop:262 length:153 start_codon:yes stop_codon:yes gene_type:complete